MKKSILLSLVLASTVVALPAKTPAKAADFSGNWVLDTSRSKNLPQGLESYSMAVQQTQQQLNVKTTLKGDLRPVIENPRAPNSPNAGPGQGQGAPGQYPGTQPGGYPGGMGMPGGVGIGMPGGMGMPAGGMGPPMGGGMGGPMGGIGIPGIPGIGRHRKDGEKTQAITAFTLYPPKATYQFDGSATSAKLGGPSPSDATAHANWEKGGKVLRLSLLGSDDSDRRGGELQIKDNWKLSKDGRLLSVDRTVHTPDGSRTVHLVFRKESTSSSDQLSKG
jgi:hypothetical protein